MKHYCPEREKLEELKSPKGQAAYAYYSEWMRLQKRSIPDQERFLHSRQYNYFMKFSEWSEKTAIPNPNQFIKVMVQTGTNPLLWCRDTTFALYLQWYDNAYSPADQFIETFDRLVMYALDFNVALPEVFNAIGPKELSRLVRRRKLSPWLLTASMKFLKWVQSLPDDEREMVTSSVNLGAYANRLKNNPEMAREFRAACESEGL